MTPLERLLQEAIPVRPASAPTRSPWTPEQQAQHRADLLDDLNSRRRHLRLIRADAA